MTNAAPDRLHGADRRGPRHRAVALLLAALLFFAVAAFAVAGLRDLWVFVNLYAQTRATGR